MRQGPPVASTRRVFAVQEYDLAATLSSGQVFRWRQMEGAWAGVVGSHKVRLKAVESGIAAEVSQPVSDWQWLARYLQVDVNLERVLKTFPDDEPMRAAVAACRGLRLLRQDPWECLASFILSSTKQIVQIQQVIAQVCACFGPALPGKAGDRREYGFPGPERLGEATEKDLRGCKMGFRAPYLLAAARKVAKGGLDLSALERMKVGKARAALMELPGVGRKIADCVLLFAYGFQAAFPVDVWVMKGLSELYFNGRKANLKQLHQFVETHFGENAGYAQQYLFHYMRMKGRRAKARE